MKKLMCFSCHIRHLTKCPNWCRTWNICFLLIFSWKMLQPNFAFWDIFMLLRCLNSKEIKLQSSINVICIIFDLIFFQLKIKRKQIFQVRHQFGHFVKCRIWHEKHITYYFTSPKIVGEGTCCMLQVELTIWQTNLLQKNRKNM